MAAIWLISQNRGEFMKLTVRGAIFLLISLAYGFALDGIAVVDHTLSDVCRPSADIYRLDMKDGHFGKPTPLYIRADHRYQDHKGRERGYGGWSPSINYSGTYIAFGRQTASGWKLSVMSIDSGEAELYDLTDLPGALYRRR
jgi:hypothetical protein